MTIDKSLQKKAYIYSIIIHLLIFLIVLFLIPKPKSKTIDILEIQIGDRFGEGQGLGMKGEPLNEKIEHPKTQVEKESAVEDKTKKNVDVPKTKAQFDEPKISQKNKVDNSKVKNESTTQSASETSGNQGSGFDIQWGGKGKRKIYKYIIPPYPDGVQVEANVKLRFTILPDGSVTRITPLVKTHPILESVSMNALSKWRFEPLDDGDYEQTVTIIFPFRLK
jgi:outer membrane biosynthesis protein TonB